MVMTVQHLADTIRPKRFILNQTRHEYYYSKVKNNVTCIIPRHEPIFYYEGGNCYMATGTQPVDLVAYHV